jgi:hypothetical protein
MNKLEFQVSLETKGKDTVKIIDTHGQGERGTRAFIFLRSAFPFVKKQYKKEANSNEYNLAIPGVYILVNEDNKEIYIGIGDDVIGRLVTHYHNNDKTEYWVKTMVFVKDGASMLNISQLKYLESRLLDLANIAAAESIVKFKIKNGQDAKPPHINNNEKQVADRFLDDLLFITKALDLTFFESDIRDKEIFSMKVIEADGKMVINGKDYIVLKGSKGNKNFTGSCSESIKNNRKHFKSKLETKGSTIITKENIKFKSPSAAAGFLTGSAVSGKDVWKNAEGKSLNDLKI